MITVLGASGHVGEKVAKQLLKKGQKIRAVARHSEKLRDLASDGAQLCVGDIGDPKFLTEILRGCDSAFTMIPPDLRAPSMMQHYRRISESIVEAVHASGIRFIVNLSSLGAEHDTGTGPIKGLHEHEKRLNSLKGVNVLHLRPTYFMENLLSNIPLIQSKGILGGPIKGDLPLPMIATQDIADMAARRLIARDFEEKVVHVLLGQRDLTMNEVAAILSRVLNRKIPYVTFDYPSARAAMIQSGLSADTADQFIEMSEAFNSGRVSSARLRAASTTTPTSFEDFAPVFKEALGESRVAA